MSHRRPRVRIALPAYNEEDTLGSSVMWLHGFCLATLDAYDWSLLIVNNGSADATGTAADRLSVRHPRIEALHLPQAGRGGALLHAARLPGADYLVYMDVDLSTDLHALPRVLSALDAGADLVVGSRHHPAARVQRGLYRDLLSRGYNLLLRTVMRTQSFCDAQCGFKAMRLASLRPLLEKILDRSWFFDTELLVLAEFGGLQVVEIPVRWIEDPDSRVDVASIIPQYLLGVLRLRLTARKTGGGI